MMRNKPRRRNGEVAMSREITSDKLQTARFLAGAMAAVTIMIRNSIFAEGLLDDALNLMDDEEKARITAASSDIAHARILLQSTLLDLALIGDDLDPESDDVVGEDDE